MTYPTAPDNFASALPLPGDAGSYPYDPGTPTTESGEPHPGAGRTVWFTWTAGSGMSSVTFTTQQTPYTGTSWDSTIAVGTASDPTDVTTFSRIASNDDGGLQYGPPVGGYGTSTVTLSVSPGTTYYVQVGSYDSTLPVPCVIAWGAPPPSLFTGPWVDPPLELHDETLTRTFATSDTHEYQSQSYVAGSGSWIDAADTYDGVVAASVSDPPMHPAYAEFVHYGDPPYFEGDPPGTWDSDPDGWFLAQMVFHLDFTSWVRSFMSQHVPAFVDWPSGAVGIEFEGHGPGTTIPSNPAWVVAAEARLQVDVNKTLGDFEDRALMASAGLGGVATDYRPQAAGVQVRTGVPISRFSGDQSTFLTATELALEPLVWEQATDDTVDQALDSGYVSLPVTALLADDNTALYLTISDQVSLVDPAPLTLPARNPASPGVQGASMFFYSTARWRSSADGSEWYLPLRVHWRSDRYRFLYASPPTTTAHPLRQLQRGDGLTGRGPRQWALPTFGVRQGPGAIR